MKITTLICMILMMIFCIITSACNDQITTQSLTDEEVAEVKILCECAFKRCHGPFHQRYGTSDIISIAACDTEVNEGIQNGGSDAKALLCRIRACQALPEEAEFTQCGETVGTIECLP